MNNKFYIKTLRNCLRIAFFSLLIYGCGQEAGEESDESLVPDHIGKARVFYHQGDYSAAVEMYHKALELDPDNASIYLQLGIIYDDNLKDEEQAVYYYNQFLIRDPDSDKAKRVRGWITKSTEMIEEGNGNEGPGMPVPDTSHPSVILPSAALLPTPAEVIPSVSVEDNQPESTQEAEVSYYTVKPGDTLAGIAEKVYNDRTAWRRIYQANRDKLANPDALQVGQKIIIPGKRDRAVIEI